MNTPLKGFGRGALLQALVTAVKKAQYVPAERQSNEIEESRMLSPTSKTPTQYDNDPEDIQMPGSVPIEDSKEEHQRLDLIGNCVGLLKVVDVQVYEYEVRFSPPIEARTIRQQLINSALELIEVIGRSITIDCTRLRVPIKLNEEVTSVLTKMPNINDGDFSMVTVDFKYTGLCSSSEIIQHYNSILYSIFTKLDMHQIMRCYYSTKNISKLPNYEVDVWQGFDAGIHECEDGILLQCDVVTKVVHSNSVLNLLTKYYYKSQATFRRDFESHIKGLSVMTKYNYKSYRIDDISWDMNPTSTFVLATGEKMSFVEYYKRTYDCEIQDQRQPLLVHKKIFKGDTSDPDLETKPQDIFLIPELCYLMGITNEMRLNNKLIQAINFKTRVSPNLHKTRVQELVETISNNEETKAMLTDWGLKLDTSLLKISGRLLKPEVLTFGGQKMFEVNEMGNWTKVIENEQFLRSVALKEWAVIFADINTKEVREFSIMISKIFFNLGVEFSDLKPVELSDDRIESYLKSANELVFNTDVQLLLFVVPDDFKHTKNIVSFCLELDVAYQLVPLAKIRDGQRLRTVAQDIARHIVCKLGGEPWSVHLPLKFSGTMLCGIDTYPRRGEPNIVGFVSSFNHSFTKWHSSVAYQDDDEHEEVIDCLMDNFISALKKYVNVNNVLPDKIVIYRCGVSNAHLNHVLNVEVKKIKEILCSLEGGYAPEVAVIVVQKTRTRLYLDMGIQNNNGINNPLPGTVVDKTVTSDALEDFFLISRHVHQGTISPTRYIVVYNTTIFKLKDLESLSYKLAHLNFKQPCTTAQPAPAMFAHDIARYYNDIPQDAGMPVFHYTLFFI